MISRLRCCLEPAAPRIPALVVRQHALGGVFFDHFQVDVGLCGIDEIAFSVLAAVISHQPKKGWTMTDAG